MNARSPSAARATRARSTRPGSLAAGRSPGHSTPRSLAGSAPRPSRSSGTGVDGVWVTVMAPQPFLRQSAPTTVWVYDRVRLGAGDNTRRTHNRPTRLTESGGRKVGRGWAHVA